ncbi:Tetratricopeptide repeat protein 5 [Quaeritorhiza haematococci]|nr:Tetratricopeptide repeat protein 5 [Quaeritorhiza haematococci]
MILRSGNEQGSDREEANVEQSIKLCKEAISMDTKDSRAWYGLATSYLKRFYNVSQDTQDLNRALAAYNQAAANVGADTLPELYYTRGIIHLHLEDFPAAIADHVHARALDPVTLTEQVTTRLEKIADMVLRVSEALTEKVGLSATRIETLATALADHDTAITNPTNSPTPTTTVNKTTNDPVTVTSTSNSSQSQQHQNGKSTKPTPQQKQEQQQQAHASKVAAAVSAATRMREREAGLGSVALKSFGELRVGGGNGGEAVRIRVLAELQQELAWRRIFIALDKTRHFFAVSAHNMQHDALKVGDEVVVLDPCVVEVDLRGIDVHGRKLDVKYPTVRIDDFSKLVVNGLRLRSRGVEFPKLGIETHV